MPRKLRYIPTQGALVEITNQVIQGRFLLRPSAEVSELILGIVGRAQRQYEVSIVYMTWMSNHFHLLLNVRNAKQVADFMRDVQSQIAKEIGHLHDWRDRFWASRYHMIVVSDEPKAQIARLRYCLSQGVKDGLVSRIEEWPGVQGANHLLHGQPLDGMWFNRTKECVARQRGETFERLKYAEKETVILSQLPCWQHLTPERYREEFRLLIEDIEKEADIEHDANGSKPLGVQGILTQDPHFRPKDLKRSPAPAFHAISKAVKTELREAYRWFEAAFRIAAERLRDGDRSVKFPDGSFPPALPFVGRLAISTK